MQICRKAGGPSCQCLNCKNNVQYTSKQQQDKELEREIEVEVREETRNENEHESDESKNDESFNDNMEVEETDVFGTVFRLNRQGRIRGGLWWL